MTTAVSSIIGSERNSAVFTSSGSHVVPSGKIHFGHALIVGGGQGGGCSASSNGGDGGDVVYAPFRATAGTITVTVGTGGAGVPPSANDGTAGNDSSISGGGLAFPITAKGGGNNLGLTEPAFVIPGGAQDAASPAGGAAGAANGRSGGGGSLGDGGAGLTGAGTASDGAGPGGGGGAGDASSTSGGDGADGIVILFFDEVPA